MGYIVAGKGDPVTLAVIFLIRIIIDLLDRRIEI